MGDREGIGFAERGGKKGRKKTKERGKERRYGRGLFVESIR